MNYYILPKNNLKIEIFLLMKQDFNKFRLQPSYLCANK